MIKLIGYALNLLENVIRFRVKIILGLCFTCDWRTISWHVLTSVGKGVFLFVKYENKKPIASDVIIKYIGWKRYLQTITS